MRHEFIRKSLAIFRGPREELEELAAFLREAFAGDFSVQVINNDTLRVSRVED